MAKLHTVYRCGECGYESGKWMGKCPGCGSWNTMTEQLPEAAAPQRAAGAGITAPQATPLASIPPMDGVRTKTSIGELNRVLGGGVVRGSVVLAGGEPGIGKSTLFLQAADSLCKSGKVLYISGEESGEQVKLRADRLHIRGEILFLAETRMEAMELAIDAEKPDFIIVDSIQTVYHSGVTSSPGSVSQVRRCASGLARIAKQSGASVFIIGHVTKDGAIAGPRALEHLVDTVLYFEGERHSSFRILRAVKNRFGSTNEIGVFQMGDAGMREVENPSGVLLGQRESGVSGAAVFAAVEGTRPVLLEVEALVCETPFGMPRRLATGMDSGRMSLIIAVLEKKIGLKLYNQDIFVNVGGGMRVAESALDLAAAAAIVSSFRAKPLCPEAVFMGEIALTGELRHISQADKRAAEAARMGMRRAIVPQSNARELAGKCSMAVTGARNLFEAIEHMF